MDPHVPSSASELRRWSLYEANRVEVRRRAALVRGGVIVILAVGIVLATTTAALVGESGLVPLVLWLGIGMAALAARRFRLRVERPLESSAIVAAWMAHRGLIDESGTLTEAGEVRLEPREDSPASDSDAGAVLESFAVRAFADSRRLNVSDSDWLEPLVGARRLLDRDREIERELRATLAADRKWSPLVWLLVLPLALVGLGLLVLSVVGAIASLLGADQ